MLADLSQLRTFFGFFALISFIKACVFIGALPKNGRVKTKCLPLTAEIWQSAVSMFLRSIHRKKDGKDHRYFSIVENHRIRSGKTVQRTVLYLGEINDQQ